MADFLYERMAKRTRKMILTAMAVLYLSIVGMIMYGIIHFVTKFW